MTYITFLHCHWSEFRLLALPNQEGDKEKYSLSRVTLDKDKFPFHGGKKDGDWGVIGCPFHRGDRLLCQKLKQNYMLEQRDLGSVWMGKGRCYPMDHEMCLCLKIRLIRMYSSCVAHFVNVQIPEAKVTGSLLLWVRYVCLPSPAAVHAYTMPIVPFTLHSQRASPGPPQLYE